MFHSSLRRNELGMASSAAVVLGTAPSQSQLVPDTSGSRVNHPPRAKAAAGVCGNSVQVH